MGQTVSYILRCICGEAEEEEKSDDEQNLLSYPLNSNSCSKSWIDSSSANNVAKHQFMFNPLDIQVSHEKAQRRRSCIDLTNIDQVLQPDNLLVAPPNLVPSIDPSSSTGGTLLHEVFDDTFTDFTSIDSSMDEALQHELFIDPSTDVPCMDMSNDQALVHEPFIDPSSTDVPSINTSNDQALVHELSVDPSIDVPSIDSSTNEAFLPKLEYTRAGFQIFPQFKVTDLNTQVVEDKSEVHSPNTSSKTKKRRKRKGAKARKEAADFTSIDSSKDEALQHELFIDPSIDVPSIDSSTNEASVPKLVFTRAGFQIFPQFKVTDLNTQVVEDKSEVHSPNTSSKTKMWRERKGAKARKEAADFTSIDSSKDEALQHELFIDPSIDVPSIDSSTNEASVPKLVFTRAGFQIFPQFKVTDLNTQVVEDKSEVHSPNTSSKTKMWRERKGAKARKEAADFTSIDSSKDEALQHELFIDPSIDVPSIDSSTNEASVPKLVFTRAGFQIFPQFKVTDLNTQVVEDKSEVHSPNTSSKTKMWRERKGAKARKEAADFTSIDSSKDEALQHELFIDPSIDVPSIDSSTNEASVPKLVFTRAGFQIFPQFKVTDLNTQVVEDKSEVHSPNTSSKTKMWRERKGAKARKEAADFTSIDSSMDEALQHELFIDPSTDVPCTDMINDQALVHELFIHPSSTDVPSINTSNDQALVHELSVDPSIDVPSIDSSTNEAFVPKLVFTRAGFQILPQFKVTDLNTQVVEDKSEVHSPNTSSKTKMWRKRKGAKARKEAADFTSIDSSMDEALQHELFIDPSTDVPCTDMINDQALVHELFIHPSSTDVPSINTSNDQALVHELSVDPSIDVPSIDSSTNEAFVPKLVFTRAGFQILPQFKVTDLNTQVVEDKSEVHSPNTSSKTKMWRKRKGAKARKEAADFTSIDSSMDEALQHELFIDPSTDVPCTDMINDQALVHELFIHPSSTDVPSINTSNDQALVHELSVDPSIDVPSIDSSTNEAFVPKLVFTRAGFQILPQFKVTDLNTQVVEDKSEVHSPNTSSKTKMWRKRKGAKARKEAADFTSIDSSMDEALQHELFIDPSTDVPCTDMINDQALVHELFIHPSSTDVPSINTSNDQALVHELSVDPSINVPSIDSSTNEAFLPKLEYTRAGFRTFHQFKVTDLNTQVVEDKSQVHLPKKRRKRKGAKARKEAAVVIERKIKHYSSLQKILLVGEGDFSFSACLARSFGSASNIVATSLDSTGVVIGMYKEAKSNLEKLEKLGATLLDRVDATKMKLHTDLQMRKFDRIIFNFPHAGFLGKEDNVLVIGMHRDLVHGFFSNAKSMLRPNGEIHVNHKTTAPFCDWNLEEIASRNSLVLIQCVDFKREDYPGYNQKRGAGSRCDDPFPLGECSTFKFIFSPTAAKGRLISFHGCQPQQESPIRMQQYQDHSHQMEQQFTSLDFRYCQPNFIASPIRMQQYQDHSHQMEQQFTSLDFRYCQPNFIAPPIRMQQYQDHSHQMEQQFTSLDFRYCQPNFIANMSGNVQENVNLPFSTSIQNDCSRIFDGYFSHVITTFGRTDYDVGYSVREALNHGFERYMAEAPGRTLNGYIHILHELHRLSTLRSARLKKMLSDLDH